MRKIVVPQGQRVIMPRNAVTGLLTPEIVSLLRAENTDVDYWQVNLAPIYRIGIGPVIEGMPAFAFPPLLSGDVVVLMTWGGGGVNFRTRFRYPKTGASFVVSGDNIQIDVQAQDLANVYTVANTPVTSGWVKPLGAPTSFRPLLSAPSPPTPLYGPQFISPYTKAIHVGVDTAGATVTVNLTVAGALVHTYVWTAGIVEGDVSIPVAADHYLVEVFADVGNVMVQEEYAFT